VAWFVIEMTIGDNGSPRSSTARVKEAAELSVIDERKFKFMVDVELGV
jgi:hypothetical protein